MTTPDLPTLINEKLLSTDGELRTCPLRGKLLLAYAGNQDEGRLTLSRKVPSWPSDTEIDVTKRDFAAAALLRHMPIHSWEEIGREEVDTKSGRYHAVRLRVLFGEQLSLFP